MQGETVSWSSWTAPPTDCLWDTVQTLRYFNYLNDSRLSALAQLSEQAERTRHERIAKCENEKDWCSVVSYEIDDPKLLETFCERADGIYHDVSLALRCRKTGRYDLSGKFINESFTAYRYWKHEPLCLPRERLAASRCSPKSYSMVNAYRYIQAYSFASGKNSNHPAEDETCEWGFYGKDKPPKKTSISRPKDTTQVVEGPTTSQCLMFTESNDMSNSLEEEYQHIGRARNRTSNCTYDSDGLPRHPCLETTDYSRVEHVLQDVCEMDHGQYIESSYCVVCRPNTNHTSTRCYISRPRCLQSDECTVQDYMYMQAMNGNCTAYDTSGKPLPRQDVTAHFASKLAVAAVVFLGIGLVRLLWNKRNAHAYSRTFSVQPSILELT